MRPEPEDLIGEVVAKTYRLERIIGRGGMGVVYEGQHLRLPTHVAIKVLFAEVTSNPAALSRFQREAQITSGLKHPNILQVHDFNRLPDGTPYIVMDFLEGEDLRKRLERGGRMAHADVRALLRAVGNGLSAAHRRNIVHRDLKPQNIFLRRVEEDEGTSTEVPTLVDFGISKIKYAEESTQITLGGTLLGTPNYMAPEQAKGDIAEIDPRSDQFTLAAIAYECLTGRRAFPGDNLASIIYQVVIGEPPRLRTQTPDCPAYAEAAILRALSKKREERFPAIRDFVHAFAGETVIASEGTGPLQLLPSAATPAPGEVGTTERQRASEVLDTEPVVPAPAMPYLEQAPPVPRRSRRWGTSTAGAIGALVLLGGGALAARYLYSRPLAQMKGPGAASQGASMVAKIVPVAPIVVTSPAPLTINPVNPTQAIAEATRELALAVTARKTKRFKEAERHYRAAFEAVNDLKIEEAYELIGKIHLGLALINQNQGKLDIASPEITAGLTELEKIKTASKVPTFFIALASLFRAQIAQNQREKEVAIKNYQKAAAGFEVALTDPKYNHLKNTTEGNLAEALYQYGTLIKVKDSNKAKAAFEKALPHATGSEKESIKKAIDSVNFLLLK